MHLATNAPAEGQAGFGSGPLGGGRTGEGALAGAGLVGLLGVAALIAIAIALFLIQGSISEQSCVRKAEAQYPTVPVSAFVAGKNPQTGPLKVSFSKERAEAVKAC